MSDSESLPTERPARGSRRGLFLVVILAALAVPAIALAIDEFPDVPDSNVHHDSVRAIAQAGVTAGCGGGLYCPSDAVRRDQMASFMDRLGALSGQTPVVNAATVAPVVQVQATNTVQNATANTVFAQCPAGTMVTGGGGTFSSTEEWVLRISTPTPDSSGWQVSYVPLSGNPGDSLARARALCVAVTP